MPGLLSSLATLVARHRRLVALAWLAAVIGGAWFSLHQTDRLSGGGWEVPGSESFRAKELLDRFPARGGARLGIMIESASPASTEQALTVAGSRVDRFDQVETIAPAQRFDKGRAALLPLAYQGPPRDEIDFADDLREAVVDDEAGTTTRVLGDAAIWSNFQEVSKEQLAKAETIGFPLILILLIAAFGTLVAAVAPLLLGFVAVFVTGAVVYLLAGALEMSIYVTNMASMIGIGVAVDYSLFVVSTFRRELSRGNTVQNALSAALSSAGTAVVFSGLTVVVSLLGLFIVDLTAVRSMAIGAITVVTVAVLATVTLLPALLALAGGRIERLPIRLSRRSRSSQGAFWRAWTGLVMRRPLPALAIGTAAMVAIALPVVSIETRSQALTQLPRDSEVRRATERVSALAGPGLLAPIQIVATDRAAALQISSRTPELAAIARATSPIPAPDGSAFLIEATMAVDPESRQGRELVPRVRSVAGQAVAEHGGDAATGGMTAQNLDLEDALAAGFWQMTSSSSASPTSCFSSSSAASSSR